MTDDKFSREGFTPVPDAAEADDRKDGKKSNGGGR